MDGELLNGLRGEIPQDSDATEQEVETLLIGFLDSLVLEQRKARGFTHAFSQLIRPSDEVEGNS